ncbi:MAG: anion permease [Egibacteraceae bacterium]
MSEEQDRTLLQRLGLPLAVVAFLLPLVLQPDGLDAAGHRMFGIFLAAIVLWITEAVPLYATAVLIIFGEILLISDATVLPLPAGFEAPPVAEFYAALANPVLMLFLGGFFLAEGAAKYRLDRNLARVAFKRNIR